MKIRPISFLALVFAVALPGALRAQVIGRLPEQAVLKDVESQMRMGAFVGWLSTGKDPVGVGGKSAPIVGVRWDTPMSGPVYFSTRMFGVKSTHDVYDPNAPEGSRRIGSASTNQVGMDVALDVALTGARTWRGVQPLAHIGAGFMVGVGNHFDGGQYATGGSILYSYGLGARFPTSKHSEFRADLSWLLYQVRYPQVFRTTTAADNQPLRGSGSLTPFTSNKALTASWTWGVFR